MSSSKKTYLPAPRPASAGQYCASTCCRASWQFAAEFAALCQVKVSKRRWHAFLDAHIPMTDSTGQPLAGHSLTMAGTKRDSLTGLYRADPRVAPWPGTAHGVLQAMNTYEHHEGVIRGDRAERNGLKTLTGDFGRLDRSTCKTLKDVLELLSCNV